MSTGSYCFHNLILTSCYSFIDCRASQDFYILTLFIQAHFHCLCTCVKNESILSTSSTVFQLTIITLHLTKFIHTLPLDSRHSDNICKATYCYSVNTYQRNTLCYGCYHGNTTALRLRLHKLQHKHNIFWPIIRTLPEQRTICLRSRQIYLARRKWKDTLTCPTLWNNNWPVCLIFERHTHSGKG